MRKLLLVLIIISSARISYAQDFGLSFTYFFPNDGDFSIPVTPFSVRGLGVDFTSFMGVETGGTFYRMSGMNMKDIPFESDEALVGPFFSAMIPLEFTLFYESRRAVYKLKGGGFGFYNFGTKLNEGNIDRALRDDLGWAVLNSNFEVDNKLGFGYLFGGEVIYYLNKKLGVNIEVQYLQGESELNLSGTYSGLESENSSFREEAFAAPDAKLDFSGVEISLGAIISP